MSHTAKIELGRRKGTTILVVCGECGRLTDHEILVDAGSRDQSPDGDIHVWDDYLTLQCRGCKTLSFCLESVNSEDTDSEGQPLPSRTLFPSRIVGRPPLRDLYHLPAELRMVYEETRSTLIENLAVLTGIRIRAIVETVCNEKRAPGRNLAQKIAVLVTLNLITKTEADILHDLRFMGNEAAHRVKAHSQSELNLAFDVVEHLLKTVYLLPEQAKLLPGESRKSNKAVKQKGGSRRP